MSYDLLKEKTIKERISNIKGVYDGIIEAACHLTKKYDMQDDLIEFLKINRTYDELAEKLITYFPNIPFSFKD